MAAISNYIISDCMNPMITAATQWFERTLDDSANRRVSISEAFLALDGVLDLYLNIASGLVVYPKVIEKHLMAELPFIATENILMRAVNKGGDRQALHEAIREYSVETARRMKETGGENDLTAKLLSDPRFMLCDNELAEILDVQKFVGLAPRQAREYLERAVRPILEKNRELLDENGGEIKC